MAGIPGRTTYAWRQIVKHLKATATHCAKCGGQLYPELAWPHPYSTSGGHILPKRDYPHLADEPTNAQAEHLHCNTAEGDAIARKQGNNNSYTNPNW